MLKLENGIMFAGAHSFRDHGLLLQQRHIGLPDKNKIIETVPFSNRQFDFSEVFGSQVYEERELTYVFTLYHEAGHEALEARRIRAVNWLMGYNRQMELEDDAVEGFYFSGEVRNGIESSYFMGSGHYEISVTFQCYPFKISKDPEGSDIWDVFNFELDRVQEVDFSVNGVLAIGLANPGVVPVTPKVTAGAAMTISLGGTSYRFNRGTTKDDAFQFPVGDFELVVEGSGSLSFEFYREVL